MLLLMTFRWRARLRAGTPCGRCGGSAVLLHNAANVAGAAENRRPALRQRRCQKFWGPGDGDASDIDATHNEDDVF